MFPSKLWQKVQDEQLEVTFPIVSKSFNKEFSYHVLNILIVCIIFCLNFAGFTCFLPSYGEKFKMNNWKSLFHPLVQVLM